LVRVLLEPALPVRVLVDPSVPQQVEDLADVVGGDDVPQADAIGVLLGHPDAGVVRQDTELVEADLSGRRGTGLDALHDADAVVRVDDLLTDLEIHTDLSFYRVRAG